MEQMTILEFIEQEPSAFLGIQESLDALLFALLGQHGSPRLYEVVKGSHGELSIVWTTRTQKEWSHILRDAADTALQNLLKTLRRS